MFIRKEINEVFTPRNDHVNNKMYISRPEIEKLLKRKLDGTKHIIIYGESGCGKSWLYKKVLNDKNITYGIINLANASRLGTITNVFNDEFAKKVPFEKTEYTDSKKASAGIGVLEGGLENQNKYSKIIRDPIREYIKLFKKQNSIIILENLESIFNNAKLMDELGNILTLLDDEDYSIKFLIVGVPSGVMQYYSNRKLLKTVSNRLTELPEVKGLNKAQVKEFLEKGLKKELKVKLDDEQLVKITNHIFWVTNGIPQKLQEYCECLGYRIKDNNWVFSEDMLSQTDTEWVLDSLHKNYTIITSMMNSIETNIGRRNQVLYCLGKIDKTCFKPNEIEALLRKEFRKSTSKKGLNISLILNELADWANTFIKKNGNEYIITDKEYILCIRIMLYKTKDEKVEKLDIENMK